MPVTISDPELLRQLTAAAGPVDLVPPDGRVIGTLVRPADPTPRFKSPVPDEEFEAARRSPDSSITLAEFW